jgi:HTH-type transcriptional regulator/antitoxin HigA
MNTALADPAEMIRRGAPRLIRNDRELEEYTRVLFGLTSKAKRSRAEEEAVELMTLLIERYESERFPITDSEPVDVLRVLLESNGLSQRDISSELGSEATVSLVLSGKRQLTREHIARLSQRFHVSPAAFFGPDESNDHGKPRVLRAAIKKGVEAQIANPGGTPVREKQGLPRERRRNSGR